MPSEARQKETGKNNTGLKMLNFGASKPGVGGGPSPRSAPGLAMETEYIQT